MGNNGGSKPMKPGVALSRAEKDLITKRWYKHIHKDEFIGAKVFDQMFNDSPKAKDAFGHFSDIDVHDDHYNEVLHRHGARVKGAVGKVIDSLNEPKEYKMYLSQLGYRHYKEYNFEPRYIDVLLTYFLGAIEESMGEDWDSDTELAFTKLFKIISFYMINSLMTS